MNVKPQKNYKDMLYRITYPKVDVLLQSILTEKALFYST